jgi:hypothetical protein
MTFQSKTGTGMINTLNKMNADPQFRNAFPSNETGLETGGYEFTISAQYIPPAISSASTIEETSR